jgi:phosphate transport system permease protein
MADAAAPAARIATPRRSGRDLALTIAIHLAAGVVAALFIWLLADLLRHGAGRLSWEFLTEAPRRSGRAGGIWPILVSTLAVLAIAIAVALPLGLGTAILMVEFMKTGSRSAKYMSLSLDILAGVPSIVFGLFGNALFCKTLGLGFSLLSGGLTLACMVLPILVRTTELGLRMVPPDWRRGAAALGISRGTALVQVILPAAMPAVVAGLMLGIGRVAAETAALIFTSGYVDRMPGSLFDSGRVLAVHIFDLTMNVSGGEAHAYASALVLVAALIVINATALRLSDRFSRGKGLAP